MLRDDVYKYTKLTGEDGWHVPIIQVGAYLDGYDKGIELLDKIRTEIKEKIEQEEFARSVFRHEEKDTIKAEQCTGSIMAYNNMIKLIDKHKAESEGKENDR